MFNPSGRKYCGGLYSDGRHLHVLIVSEKDLANQFNIYVYMKDIVFYTDDHLIKINMYSGQVHP